MAQTELDKSRTLATVTRHKIEVIEARLADRTIVAPFSGVLGLRLVSEGALVTPGQRLTTLDDLARMRLNFSVPATQLGFLVIGQSIQAVSPAFDEVFEGKISAVETRLMPLVENGEIKRLLIRAGSSSGGVSYNRGFAILVLADRDSGRRSTWEIQADARERVADVAGVKAYVRGPRSLGGSNQDPVQFVVGGNTYEELAVWQDLLRLRIADNPKLVGVDSDLEPTKPQIRVSIDRNRAGDLGVSLLDLTRTLETLLGSRKVTTFIRNGREYDVILEGERSAQRSLTELNNIFIRSTTTDKLIPLANLVSITEQADAASLNRYNRVRALTLSADLAEGYSLGDALSYLEELVRTELSTDASYDYKGESLEYQSAGNSVVFTFVLALLVVYLVMAAQFESFIHPLIILFTVPLALIGGLGGLILFDSDPQHLQSGRTHHAGRAIHQERNFDSRIY